MKRNDWIGLGTSIGVHALILLLFAFVTGASPKVDTLGYIEVDFGPLAEGRPVQRSVDDRAQPEEQPTEREPQPRPSSTPPEEARPVDLPTQERPVQDEERVESPQSDRISPERPRQREERTEEANVAATPVSPPGAGARDGDTGASSGDQGESAEETASAPYQIEGLNRNALHAPLPAYPAQVNAVIRVRIAVDPQGRIVERVPLLKGDPALERAVMQALERWRFDPLPANVPRTNQVGTVTFRFRLE
jgi:periplasmic protein TonB